MLVQPGGDFDSVVAKMAVGNGMSQKSAGIFTIVAIATYCPAMIAPLCPTGSRLFGRIGRIRGARILCRGFVGGRSNRGERHAWSTIVSVTAANGDRARRLGAHRDAGHAPTVKTAGPVPAVRAQPSRETIAGDTDRAVPTGPPIPARRGRQATGARYPARAEHARTASPLTRWRATWSRPVSCSTKTRKPR